MNTQIIETNTVTTRRDLSVGEYFRHPGCPTVYQVVSSHGSIWDYPHVRVADGVLCHCGPMPEVERLEILGEPVQFRVKN